MSKYRTEPTGLMQKTPNRKWSYLKDVLTVFPMWIQMYKTRKNPKTNFGLWAVYSLAITALSLYLAIGLFPTAIVAPIGAVVYAGFNFFVYAGEQQRIEHEGANAHQYDEEGNYIPPSQQ